MLRTIKQIEEELGDEYEDVGDAARTWAASNDVQRVEGTFVLTEDEFASFLAWLESEPDEDSEESDDDSEEDDQDSEESDDDSEESDDDSEESDDDSEEEDD